MKKNQIIIVSKNREKIKETKEILSEYEIISIKEIGIDVFIKEDKETFEENAIKKAKEVSKLLDNKICISDDSGIEIKYLNGFPGVKTKRWLKGTDRERNIAILEKMKGIEKEKREAKFITAIAIAKGEEVYVVKEEIKGFISNEIRGKNGFGFDEIFELEDGRTLAELKDEEKNQISSRKKALEKIKDNLKNI